jgi:hypothetical protein
VKPVLQALILADHIYTDRATGKKVIAGTFSRLLFRRMAIPQVEDSGGQTKMLIPGGGDVGSPSLYISLTDFQGRAKFAIQYVDLKDNKVLFDTAFEGEGGDPLATAELVLRLPRLPVTHEGTYALELLCNNELLGSLRITVQEVREEQKE